ncbi:MAG: TetR/AcrR family transcriptional regulator [Prevotellaceae bacterium]|jgi:AcrR family transcriptional regulator|nr:TetR/AcrR family transcriptional regulator [Prevotellaceae bacterium]
METKVQKTRKPRRTKEAIDTAIWDAVERLAIKKGFTGITLTGLAKEAEIEPPVIYTRFENLDDVLKKYARKFDYWLDDIFKIDPKKSPQENYKKLLVNLIENLSNNQLMHKMLAWEVADIDPITRQFAKQRELKSDYLFTYFKEGTKDFDFDFNPSIAIMIAGIYYLTMRKQVSNFCEINFDTPQGKQILKKTISNMIDKLFVEKEKEPDLIKVARKMKADGLDNSLIAKYTGLTKSVISKIK